MVVVVRDTGYMRARHTMTNGHIPMLYICCAPKKDSFLTCICRVSYAPTLPYAAAVREAPDLGSLQAVSDTLPCLLQQLIKLWLLRQGLTPKNAAHNDAVCIAIVAAGHGAEALLPCCVPLHNTTAQPYTLHATQICVGQHRWTVVLQAG